MEIFEDILLQGTIKIAQIAADNRNQKTPKQKVRLFLNGHPI